MSITGKSGYKKIGGQYSYYKVKMNDIWRAFNFYEFSLLEAKNLAKRSDKDFHLTYVDLLGSNLLIIPRDEIFGIIESHRKKSNHVRAFLDGVITTENYLKDIALIVYEDFPDRLKNEGGIEADKREEKLLNIILDSFDKEEMLSKITEERIRGIFYGNPIDFFKKDRANLRLKNFFASNHALTLEHFTEIIARRNIYIHNDGRVDRKYLREVPNSLYRLDSKAPISTFYLRHSLMILRALGLLVTNISVKENYYMDPRQSIQSEVKAINRRLNF
jgi:hypothetical protein